MSGKKKDDFAPNRLSKDDKRKYNQTRNDHLDDVPVVQGGEYIQGAPKNRSSPSVSSNGVKLKAGDAARNVSVLKQIMMWQPVDRRNVQAMEERFWYFVGFCEQNDINVTNQLAYLAIGITKQDAYNWMNGRSGTPAHCELIQKVKQFCAAYREMLGVDGKINPVTLIWWQKNYDGLVDNKVVEVKPVPALGEQMDKEELARRLSDVVVDDYSVLPEGSEGGG